VIASLVGTAVVVYMFIYSRKSHVGHHNAVEVEEAGTAVRFRKKNAKKQRLSNSTSKDVQA
jgi:PiT family inorganic phosphate transporter